MTSQLTVEDFDHRLIAYINQGIPPFPKVTFRYDTNRITQLELDIGWDSYHETDELGLDGFDFALGKFVLSILVL